MAAEYAERLFKESKWSKVRSLIILLIRLINEYVVMVMYTAIVIPYMGGVHVYNDVM